MDQVPVMFNVQSNNSFSDIPYWNDALYIKLIIVAYNERKGENITGWNIVT